jgi:hypothetical protein
VVSSGQEYLFDLDSDPDEQYNLAKHTDHTSIVAHHRHLL